MCVYTAIDLFYFCFYFILFRLFVDPRLLDVVFYSMRPSVWPAGVSRQLPPVWCANWRPGLCAATRQSTIGTVSLHDAWTISGLLITPTELRHVRVVFCIVKLSLSYRLWHCMQCGRPMEQNNCRACGAVIGGTNHTPVAGNVVLNR